MKKFLALFDLHFGFEKGFVNGRWITRPTHNLPLVKAVNKFAEDFKPDILLSCGDEFNFGPISHWNRGKPRLTEGLRVKDELDLFKEHIMEPYKSVERKIMLKGNHNIYLDDFIAENPEMEGLLEINTYLGLENDGWEVYDQGKIIKIGKLHFCHGDVILKSGNYVNPAQQLINSTRVNIRCGHLHTYYAATDINPLNSKDYHTAIVVPSMCLTNPFYVKNRPNKFINGFLYGYIYPDGNFIDFVVITYNNKFIINGVEYK